MDQEDDWIDQLYIAYRANDMVKYKHLVDSYDLTTVSPKFWIETFTDCSREEIEFWINYPQRRFAITEIYSMSIINDDLFDLALTRSDIDMTGAEEIINCINDMYDSEDESSDETIIMKTRIHKIRAFIQTRNPLS